MGYDTARGRKTWDRQIRRVGGRVGAIRRDGTDILIMCAVSQYSPREARGALIEPTDQRMVISTFKPNGTDLSTVPDKETDQLVLYRVPLTSPPVDEIVLNMVQAPTLHAPHGVLMVIECQVRK